MRKAMLVVGMMSVLGGCERGAVPDTPLMQAGVSTVSPKAGAVVEGVKGASALRDPESTNGLTKKMLGAKAFTVTGLWDPPEGNAEVVIQALEGAAKEGSGKASYEIYLKIAQCANLLKPGRKSTPNDSRRWADCKDLAPDRLINSADWLRLSASQGHLGAQILFASDSESVLGGMQGIFRSPDSVDQYKRDAHEYMSNASKRGSIDALLWLGDAYRYGVLADQDGTTAYAYYLAMSRAAPDHLSKKFLAAVESELTPMERQRSILKSKEIFNECCR